MSSNLTSAQWFPELMKLALQSKFRPTIPWYYADDI